MRIPLCLKLLPLFAAALLTSSCGEKFDSSVFPEIEFTDERTVQYVQLSPAWIGFNQPEDVHVGYDEFIYVADTGNDRVVMLDINGTVVGISQPITRPVAIAQDRKLDLLVAARKDTLGTQVTCLFRLNLLSVNHRIAEATPIAVVVHPFYFRSDLRTGDDIVEFTGVATLSTNEYYVTRSGPSNGSIIQLGGPDNNVLLFEQDDRFVSPLTSFLSALGTGEGSANDLTGITTYAVPPQSPLVDNRRGFIVCMEGDNNFKVQGMRFNEGRNVTPYEPDRTLATIDTAQGRSFLYDGNPSDGVIRSGFKQPQDVTYSSDSRYIFVVDSGTDSLYQFTSIGIEGIRPPTFSQEQKNIVVSFGGEGNGNKQFRDPFGVSYYEPAKIVLVADRGNNRIVRFKLSTDFQ